MRLYLSMCSIKCCVVHLCCHHDLLSLFILLIIIVLPEKLPDINAFYEAFSDVVARFLCKMIAVEQQKLILE